MLGSARRGLRPETAPFPPSSGVRSGHVDSPGRSPSCGECSSPFPASLHLWRLLSFAFGPTFGPISLGARKVPSLVVSASLRFPSLCWATLRSLHFLTLPFLTFLTYLLILRAPQGGGHTAEVGFWAAALSAEADKRVNAVSAAVFAAVSAEADKRVAMASDLQVRSCLGRYSCFLLR